MFNITYFQQKESEKELNNIDKKLFFYQFMETIVIKFTNFRLHLSFKLAPYGHYTLVYDTCSTYWIFLSLAEGQMWHLSGFTGRITSGFPLSGSVFCRMEPIKIRSSLVNLSLAKQRYISSFLRSEQISNKN